MATAVCLVEMCISCLPSVCEYMKVCFIAMCVYASISSNCVKGDISTLMHRNKYSHIEGKEWLYRKGLATWEYCFC